MNADEKINLKNWQRDLISYFAKLILYFDKLSFMFAKLTSDFAIFTSGCAGLIWNMAYYNYYSHIVYIIVL